MQHFGVSAFLSMFIVCWASIRQTSRKGFLSEGVPVALRGITGPGAPHLFEFDRRQSLCPWAALVGFSLLGVDIFFHL